MDNPSHPWELFTPIIKFKKPRTQWKPVQLEVHRSCILLELFINNLLTCTFIFTDYPWTVSPEGSVLSLQPTSKDKTLKVTYILSFLCSSPTLVGPLPYVSSLLPDPRLRTPWVWTLLPLLLPESLLGLVLPGNIILICDSGTSVERPPSPKTRQIKPYGRQLV